MQNTPRQADSIVQTAAALQLSSLLARFPDLREDAIQEAVAMVMARYPELDSKRQAQIAFAIARNRVLSERHAQAQATRLEHQVALSKHKLQEDPQAEAEAKDLRERLTQVMAIVLNDEERELLVRVFLQGQRLRQVAEEMGLSLSTASRRLHSALSVLRFVLRGPSQP